MKLSCYIIDDEPSGINVLNDLISGMPFLELAGSDTDPLRAFARFQREAPPQVLFLDIDMPGMSGLSLAEQLQDVIIIFCTSHREFAADAYDRQAFDYLLKPIGPERFKICMDRLFASAKRSDNLTLTIRSGPRGGVVRIRISDIVYVKGMLNYVEIYLRDSRHITHTSMEELHTKLPEGHFSRIHRSYLVGHDRIKEIAGNTVYLDNGVSVPIGRTYRKSFIEKIRKAL